MANKRCKGCKKEFEVLHPYGYVGGETLLKGKEVYLCNLCLEVKNSCCLCGSEEKLHLFALKDTAKNLPITIKLCTTCCL